MMDSRTNVTDVDPWMQMLGLLTQSCTVRDVCAAARPRGGRRTRVVVAAAAAMVERRSVAVSFLERQTATTVSLAWRDATRCAYGEQVWQAARARFGGVCAVSGRAVQPGDAIYRPRPTRPVPLNAGAMILASVLEQIESAA
ncbi:DUF3331 domain-containing protein [Burkholderia dolosa]|uniref:DUF3331 domain-containing protein n=1 Tax=Burkholderia dolosa TaxID=152500 RepID=UPI001B9D29A5|nr:DUF3331 domain-containing protein [Burkholderia dolosa]MBR8060424.1 DUF3331 domain-containing protein [Burkholderia dolosa]